MTWDGGRKTFASASHPDIFGYVGDVLTPSVVIAQFLTALDSGVLGSPSVQDRFTALTALAKQQLRDVPPPQRRPFTIIHCARIGSGMAIAIRVNVIAYLGAAGWEARVIEAPDASAELLVDGSGRGTVEERLAQWQKSDVAGTSRAVFSAFVSSVMSGKDASSGGPVQLVGLHRIGNGRVFGVWHERRRYLAGSQVATVADDADVAWFNALFERCDAQTGEVIGQRQPPPRNL
jgi:hypothetical protein